MVEPPENIWTWSTTAAENSSADSGINWAEGMPRADVNNSARSLMAAFAKERDLRNGSIVTLGTANAQTFLSGYTPPFTTIPDGFLVRLKIGPGLTNTGQVTLNMDGIGAVVVKNNRNADTGANSLVEDTYAEFIYNGTNWVVLNASGAANAAHGRLTYVSATALKFSPYGGKSLQINGLLYDIPTAGIAGLANTGVYVNSVAAQPLVADTVYWIYAFSNAGVITANFSTSSAHEPSTTVGNEGVEIATGLDDYTLIGMCRTNGSAQFVDTGATRFVRSWFNDPGIAGFTSTTFPTSYTITWAGPYVPVEFLIWAREPCHLHVSGLVYGDTAGQTSHVNLGMDGSISALAASSYHTSATANAMGAVAVHHTTQDITEGYHSAGLLFFVTGGTHTIDARNHVITNGI